MGYQVTPWGWEWRVSGERRLQVLKGLHELIMRRAIRIRWTDVQGFPERYVNWKLIDLPDSARKRIRECLDLIEEDSSLTTLLRFRQAVERYKLPAYVEIINDYVEQGISVVCWVEWLESLDTLRQAIQNCGVIFGDTPESERRMLIDKFQSNELKVLLLQTKVGGESLSLGDETGLCPRVGLISPTWSARDLLQILGRLHRMNAKSPARYYILYAAGTVEETVCKKVGQKLVRLQTSTDGGLTDFDLIPDILLKKLLKYKEKS
jgi:SNF2 family DNA or RNA helicase